MTAEPVGDGGGAERLAEIAAMPRSVGRDDAARDWILAELARAPDDEVHAHRTRNAVALTKITPLATFDAIRRRVARRAAEALGDEDSPRDGRPVPDGTLDVPGSPGWRYRPPSGDDAGEVGQDTRQGYMVVLRWAPAVPRWLETPSADGRGATAYYYEISAGGRAVLASGDELAAGEPWKLLPVEGTGTKRVREVLHSIVEDQARRTALGRAITRTGWHRGEDGQRYYVFADGRASDGREVVLVGGHHYARLAAAARPAEFCDSGDIAAAILTVAEHGRGPGLAGLGIGVRALGHSLHKVPGGFVAVGKPNAGKSSLGWHARSVMVAREGRADAWPPLPSATFADTRTRIEGALDYEADMPTLLDDAALSDKSSRAELGDVTAKLEMVFRALANDSEVRGRMDRTMLPRDPCYVRSPVIATMQGAVSDVPVQNSLLRRVVLLPVARGDIDTRWYRAAGNAAALVGPLRSLGENYVIAYLSVVGDPAGYLAAIDAEARAMLAAALEAIMPGWEDNAEGLAGVADIAACALSGLLIACAVADISPAIAAMLTDYLAAAIAAQAARMGDSAEAASPREALGDILRAALLDQRAHVRDHQGEPVPAIPGLTEQEQGLDAIGDRSGVTLYRGKGAPFYWLPDDAAIGVRPESLHKLVRAAADTRIPAMTARTLPAYLVAEGLALASHQKTGNRQKKIGGENMRLAYLVPEVLALATHENSEPQTVTTVTTATAQRGEGDSNGASGQGTRETVTAQVRSGSSMPGASRATASERSQNASDVAGSSGNSSARPKLLPATCAGCREPLGRWLADRGATRHVCCYPEGDAEFARIFGAVPASAASVAEGLGHQGDEAAPAAAVPAPRPAPVAPPRRRWAVLGVGDRAYAAGGEVIELPSGTLGAIGNAGELAAVALVLGAERLYISREVREALGLPEALADTEGPREGVPHIFTEATDPAQWDIWPGDPVGLAGWMDVYRVPRALHQGAAIVFPEWLANTPALGELPAPELARALELIHLSTTHHGEGRGGVEFHRSPATTFGRMLGKAASRSRKGVPGAIELPPPYDREAKRPRNAPAALRPPGSHMAAPAEVPEGWTLARLDVRSCFASAVTGTDFGIGDAVHSTGSELTKAPGAVLVRVPASAAVHESLLPFGPKPAGRAREALCWLDGHAARWLAECGIPVEVIESWTWPERHRVFDSASLRLGEARTRLEAAGDVPSLAAAAVVKGMANAFLGGRMASDYGGARNRDDWQWRWDWWLTTRVQAEVRKQRQLMPGIRAGSFVVLGEQFVDSVYVAAPSLASIEAAPGTRGLPAVHQDRGKFKIESHALVTGELAAVLANGKGSDQARLKAIRAALAEEGE